MAQYQLEVTEDARKDIEYFAVFERRTIVSEIRTKLQHEPTVEGKSRKRLRDNPIAKWELRSGSFRVFYEVNDDALLVSVVAVGRKEHNKLYIRGKEVPL